MISTVIRALQALGVTSVRGERKRLFESISHRLRSQTRIIWQSLLSGLTTSYASFSMNQVTSRSRQKPNSFKFLATLSIISVETSSTPLSHVSFLFYSKSSFPPSHRRYFITPLSTTQPRFQPPNFLSPTSPPSTSQLPSTLPFPPRPLDSKR